MDSIAFTVARRQLRPVSSVPTPTSVSGSLQATVMPSPLAAIILCTPSGGIWTSITSFSITGYGLTKGQYSPTSEFGKRTKSTPAGTADRPFNPLGLVIGADTSFVARSVDVFQQHLKDTLKKAAAHKGSAYV